MPASPKIQVRLDQDVVDELLELAEQRQTTVSQLARAWIVDGLKRDTKK